MRYMGGKSRISLEIAKILSQQPTANSQQPTANSGIFVSLFCGTCSIESKVIAKEKILNDKHEYLVSMLQAIQKGYVLPDEISYEQYCYIKSHKDEDKALSGFVGFGCSFGGKWFGGYARNKTGTNYALQSKNSILKDMNNLMQAKFSCLDYRDVIIPDGSIVYADPPYANTTDYGSKLKFNSNDFWEYMRKISKTNTVFISEQEAPNDFECIWQKEFTRTLDVNKQNQPKKIEKLFKYKG